MSSSPPHSTDALRNRLFALYTVVIALALLLRVASAGLFMTIQGVLALLIFNSFVGSLCLGLFLAYLGLPRRNRELAAVLAVGLAAEWILGRYRWPLTDSILVALMFGVGLGGSSLLLGLLPRAWQGRDPSDIRRLTSPLLLLMSYFVGHFTVGLVAQLSPMVYDLSAYAVDLRLGHAAAFEIQTWLGTHGGTALMLKILYGGLALAMITSQLHFLARPARYHLDPTMCFVVLGTVGGLLYFVTPVVGPAAFFDKAFPLHSPPWLNPQALPFNNLDIPRNGLPSLHAAWALSCLWTTWGAGRGFRLGMGLFFMLTLPAALAIGSHYLVDLVVSFPLTAGVHGLLVWLAEHTRGGVKHLALRSWSLASALAGLSLCTLSIVILPIGLYSWPLPLLWAWALLCVGGSWWLESRVRQLALQGSTPKP